MSDSDSDSSLQFSDGDSNNDQSQGNQYQSALLYTFPFEYLNANFPPNELPEPHSAYCAFCGRFLSNNMETTLPCKGNSLCPCVSNGKSNPNQVINQLIGPMPQRKTPSFNFH